MPIAPAMLSEMHAPTALLQFDSDLRRIIAAWGTLPQQLKRTMLAMLG